MIDSEVRPYSVHGHPEVVLFHFIRGADANFEGKPDTRSKGGHLAGIQHMARAGEHRLYV